MIKLGLERMQKLLGCLSNPHLQIPIIHVAGTNGKGSVCAFQAEIMRSSGYRVGRFTSPYLLHPADSINLDGEHMDLETFEETKRNIQGVADRNSLDVSPFELLTAVAFQAFSSSRLDLAVIEVGLGGATDSTNVCTTRNTLFSCVTPISIDHQSFLGSTITEIAAQKAGIVKPHVPLLVSQQPFPEEVHGVVRKEAHAKMCDVFFARPYPLPHPTTVQLAPLPIVPMDLCSPSPDKVPPPLLTIPNVLSPSAAFQHQNAVTAATLAHMLRTHPHPLRLLPSLSERITNETIVEGIKKTRWRGRLELINYQSRQLLLDGAHNQASAKLLGNHLTSINRPTTLIISLSSPRDPTDIVQALDLAGFTHPVQIILTRFSVPTHMQWVRPVCPQTIAHSFTQHKALKHLVHQPAIMISDSPAHALQLALSLARGHDELITICGSLYLISDILRIIHDSEAGK